MPIAPEQRKGRILLDNCHSERRTRLLDDRDLTLVFRPRFRADGQTHERESQYPAAQAAPNADRPHPSTLRHDGDCGLWRRHTSSSAGVLRFRQTLAPGGTVPAPVFLLPALFPKNFFV